MTVLQMTGHRIHISILERMGLSDCREHIQELIRKFRDLKLDQNEFTCLKFLILLNPGKTGYFLSFVYPGETVFSFFSVQVRQFLILLTPSETIKLRRDNQVSHPP